MEDQNPSRMALPPVLITLLIICSLMGSAGCMNRDDVIDDQIRVIVSILPQKEFVERVGGANVRVTVMVGEGQDPHGYEPRPSQLRDVAKADLYFKVGSGIEFEEIWMDTITGLKRDMKVIDGSEGIDLIDIDGETNHTDDEGNGDRGGNQTDDGDHEHDHERVDPHIWTSPRNAMRMVENFRDALIGTDPGNEADYVNITASYLADLEAVDRELRDGLEPHAGKRFLVYHPSFGYLAHEYNLTQIAIEDEGKEPTPAGVQAIIDQAKEENITTVFVSPQFDESNAETIADEIDGTVVRIDPLGKDYLANMREISTKLIEGFGGGGE
jgi:zinc transport system substrate-binding protein